MKNWEDPIGEPNATMGDMIHPDAFKRGDAALREKFASLEYKILKYEAALGQIVQMGGFTYQPHEFREVAKIALQP